MPTLIPNSNGARANPAVACSSSGLAGGCCVLALIGAWISSGHAAEPRGHALLVPATVRQTLPLATTPGPPDKSASAPLATSATTARPTGPHSDGAAAALPAPILVQAVAAADMTMEIFLDRVMRAESGGRLTARSSTSTALGPFQFIDATFLSVVRRHMAAETAALKPGQVLALRTDMAFSRRAAEAFTQDNAGLLVGAGLPATFQNLRLAYLLGPGGAIKVLQTDPAMPLIKLMSANVIRANPFMRPLTVSGLIARAAREVAVPSTSVAGLVATPATAADLAAAMAATDASAASGTTLAVAGSAPKPGAKVAAAPSTIVVNCDLGLASCRRWLALEQRRKGVRTVGVREARVR